MHSKRVISVTVAWLYLVAAAFSHTFIGVIYPRAWFIVALGALTVVGTLYWTYQTTGPMSEAVRRPPSNPDPLADGELLFATASAPAMLATGAGLLAAVFGVIDLIGRAFDVGTGAGYFWTGIAYLVLAVSFFYSEADYTFRPAVVDRVAGEPSAYSSFTHGANRPLEEGSTQQDSRAGPLLAMLFYIVLLAGVIVARVAEWWIPGLLAGLAVWIVAITAMTWDPDIAIESEAIEGLEDALETIHAEAATVFSGSEEVDPLLKDVTYVRRRGNELLVLDVDDDKVDQPATWRAGLPAVTAARALRFEEGHEADTVIAALMVRKRNIDESLLSMASAEQLCVIEVTDARPAEFNLRTDAPHIVDELLTELRERAGVSAEPSGGDHG